MSDFTDDIHLDELDLRLLRLLMEDSKTPYYEIAEQLELSRASITKRVNALIAKGVIERFTVYVNPKKIKLDITILFEIITAPSHTRQIMGELTKQPEIGEIFMSSASSLFAFAYFRDSAHLNEFLSFLQQLPGVHELKNNMILASTSKSFL